MPWSKVILVNLFMSGDVVVEAVRDLGLLWHHSKVVTFRVDNSVACSRVIPQVALERRRRSSNLSERR